MGFKSKKSLNKWVLNGSVLRPIYDPLINPLKRTHLLSLFDVFVFSLSLIHRTTYCKSRLRGRELAGEFLSFSEHSFSFRRQSPQPPPSSPSSPSAESDCALIGRICGLFWISVALVRRSSAANLSRFRNSRILSRQPYGQRNLQSAGSRLKKKGMT
ncbi:uncharacterized protein LOC104428100 [Eucalyptus grandis]|uniref:uncharacterized protein LOC104428100 n=1 Tax=Eucalyptus grandis TaxID=71139 RepID=UPI00192ED9F5|nr:uncharacterized protein LOC104428100 [Eucalyptus grandis]